MPKFYKQSKGLLVIPKSKSKFHVSWTLDNILSGFRHFYKENERWPVGADLKNCDYLPNVKTLERNFGGITNIRSEIGLAETNYSKGETRSNKAILLHKQGFEAEQNVYKILANYYHEPFVHNQARVVLNDYALKVDFLIYHSKGKYAVDVFFPDKEQGRFTNNVCAKFRTYKDFQFKIYLCIFNPEITQVNVERTDKSITTNRNRNVDLVLLSEFEKEILKYIPLKDPYLK